MGNSTFTSVGTTDHATDVTGAISQVIVPGWIFGVTSGAQGTGYAVGDTGTINIGDLAIPYKITAVDTGKVTEFIITKQGPSVAFFLSADTGISTAHTSGSGDDGFQVDVVGILPSFTPAQNNVCYTVVAAKVPSGLTGFFEASGA